MQTTIQLLSPMEKVMAQEEKTFAPYPKASALRGEETAFQAIVTGEGEHYIEVRTDAPVKVTVYREGYVPCTLSAYPDRFDDDYITTEPSTFPDVLYPVTDGAVNVNSREVLWVSLKVNDDAAGGDYPVEISANGKSEIFRLTVVPVTLPGAEAHVHAVVPWRLHRSALRRGDLRKRALGIVRQVYAHGGGTRHEHDPDAGIHSRARYRDRQRTPVHAACGDHKERRGLSF